LDTVQEEAIEDAEAEIK